MPWTKYITFSIGCLLLLPFIWSFVLMLRPESPTPDHVEREKMIQEHLSAHGMPVNDAGPEATFTIGFTSITSYSAVTPHQSLGNIWLLAPRKWVGVLGLVASFAMLLCLGISSFCPVMTDSFGFEHQLPEQPPFVAQPILLPDSALPPLPSQDLQQKNEAENR
jgi:hypothetical protein